MGGSLSLPQWVSRSGSEMHASAVPSWAQQQDASTSSSREALEGPRGEDAADLQPWRKAVCVILEDVLENCILEVGSQQRGGSPLSRERLQFAPMVGRLKALAAKSCSKTELRPFLRLFSRSIRLGLVPSKQSEDVQQLILDALGALDDALATARTSQQQATAAALRGGGLLEAEPSSSSSPPPFSLMASGSSFG